MRAFVMNDDFLHRMRKAPPPGFLQELKARLDRQPNVPPERKRHGFGRGVIVGFLIAGVAFATASVSLTGWPTSASQFFGAPLEYLTQAFQHRNDSAADATHTKPAQLGPWFPMHANPQTEPPPSTASATALDSNAASTNAPSGAASGAQAAPSGAVAKPTGQLGGTQIGVQRDIHAFMQASLKGSWAGSVKLIELPGSDVFTGLCGDYNNSSPRPNVVMTTRHIASEPSCKIQHPRQTVELKLGYQAIVLARSKLYAPMYISPRMLYLALAERVPDPADPNRLIDNPYTTWSSTWKEYTTAPPDDRIQVYGPAPSSPEGRLATQLLLEAGCNTFPRLAALRDSNYPEYENACHRLRNDGLYAQTPQGNDMAEMLNINPTALGVFTLPGFQAQKSRLNANPVSDVMPEYVFLGSESYPLSRTLYFYYAGYSDFWMRSLFDSLISPSFYETRYDAPWGFVALDEAESALNRANYEAHKYVQF
jgi:hypothetical protein